MELFDAKIYQTFLDALPRSCILTSSKGSVGRSVSVTVSWDGMHKDISTLLPPLASNTACTLLRLWPSLRKEQLPCLPEYQAP